jgi:perosamine synthetase
VRRLPQGARMDKPIPVYAPSLGEQEWQNVRQCLESTWISSRGEFIARFEQAFAGYVGIGHAIAVCNGTAAVHLALMGLGLGPGDKVAVPTFTFVASVNPVRYVGAEPVFVDSDTATLQLCPQDFARKAEQHRPRAVIVPHLYGQMADMDAILGIARRHGMLVIEDCAEAVGSRIGARHAGTFGDVATFSFFGNKTITTGEGGMVVANDAGLIATMRKLRGQGLVHEGEYWHDVIGYNYRMTNICAAIGLAQIERADEIIAHKRATADRYRAALDGTPLAFHDEAPGTTHSFWMCSGLARSRAERDALRQHLRTRAIETRPFFHPVHTMPMYQAGAAGSYPGAESCAARGLNLPSSPTLSDDDLTRVANAVREFYDRMPVPAVTRAG